MSISAAIGYRERLLRDNLLTADAVMLSDGGQYKALVVSELFEELMGIKHQHMVVDTVKAYEPL